MSFQLMPNVLGALRAGQVRALAVANAGNTLREEDDAEVVVMGCAGTARYRKPLQDEIGVPVVEPARTAVSMVIGRVRLNRVGS